MARTQKQAKVTREPYSCLYDMIGESRYRLIANECVSAYNTVEKGLQLCSRNEDGTDYSPVFSTNLELNTWIADNYTLLIQRIYGAH